MNGNADKQRPGHVLIGVESSGNGGDGVRIEGAGKATIVGGAAIGNQGNGYTIGPGTQAYVNGARAIGNKGHGFSFGVHPDEVLADLGLPPDADVRALAEAVRDITSIAPEEREGRLTRIASLGWRAVVDTSQVASAIIAFAMTPAGQQFARVILG